MSVPQQGTEKRTTMLPTPAPSGIGYFGSSYSPADSLKTPAQIGVRSDDTMESVIDAVRGVAFYTDMIGFGESTSPLTSGMPLKPLGINYFVNSGQKCSNGADMYQYFEGIPKGDALGSRVKNAMKEMGMPSLRGLAPGMIEDAKDGLNPMPFINSMFGTGYPQCKKVTLQVGDMYGNIKDPNTGEDWIESPNTAFRGGDGLYYQTRWVQDTDRSGNPINLTKDQWVAAKKTQKPDGTEKFTNYAPKNGTMFVVGALCLLMFGMVQINRR